MSEDKESATTGPPPPTGEARFPLAFDTNGDPIDLPPNAIAWRVRRGGGRRGRPSHVFDSETGRQLEIPLGATIEALVEAGCPPDRYLLYPVDGAGHIIPGIVAVTWVPELPGDDDAKPSEAAPSTRADVLAQLAMQQHATLQRVCEYLCRGFEAAASGYGPIRPVQKPAPTVIEAPATPAPEPSGLKAEQMGELMQLARTFFEMVRGGGAPPSAPPNS
jgi:hypothetical protein